MPSPRHDTLSQLFQDRPALAVEILTEIMDVELPPGAAVQIAPAVLNDRPSFDLHPDNVFSVGPAASPGHVIVVEIQQEPQQEKQMQMARYAAAMWLSLRCPVTILVVCPSRKAARFYTDPVRTDLPGYIFQAVVLGPDRVPLITDPREVAERPDTAALSVMAHQDRTVIATFLAGLATLPPDHAAKYTEYAHRMCGNAARNILEELMAGTTWPVSTPFAREHFGRGKAEGMAEGEAKAILFVLAARGITVPDDISARITACTDLGQLKAWAERAATATTIHDLIR